VELKVGNVADSQFVFWVGIGSRIGSVRKENWGVGKGNWALGNEMDGL
jgi:hypothetical protein